MSMMKDVLKQYTQHAADIRDIISPLQSVGIDGVFHLRIYPDGTIINLASDASWAEFYFSRLDAGLYLNQHVIDQFYIYSGASLWDLNPENPVWQDAKNSFGYKNGLLLVEDREAFKEAFCFYSATDTPSMNHFYINNIDTLKNMKQYFFSQAADLIQQAEYERLALNFAIFPPAPEVSLADNKALYRNKEESRICVFHKKTGLPIHLSQQRSQCFLHLIQGKSTKTIANEMSLTPKTVEHYLGILRSQLGCNSSKELIIYYANQLSHLT